MKFYLFFRVIITLLIAIVGFMHCAIQVISDPKLMEKSYKETLKKHILIENFWNLDIVCLGNNTQKTLICQQILEAMKLEIGNDTNLENSGWPCHKKFARLSQDRDDEVVENILKCPVKRGNSTMSYYISFGRFLNPQKSRMTVFGFYYKSSENIHILHRSFIDVDVP